LDGSQARGLDARARAADRIALCLSREIPCYVAGALLISDQGGTMVLLCCRLVDELFLRAVQRRLLSAYCLFAGPALAEPRVQAIVRGDVVSGPYEPPRSLLTMPVLVDRRVAGMLVVASVFPEAFGSADLCKMSSLAARASARLEQARGSRCDVLASSAAR